VNVVRGATGPDRHATVTPADDCGETKADADEAVTRMVAMRLERVMIDSPNGCCKMLS